MINTIAGPGGTSIAMGTPMLELREVDAGYGRVQILDNISLSVPKGGRTAILGTNGAGKSTVLKVVAGLLKCSDGAVIFESEDITELSPRARLDRGLSLISGGQSCFPSLTIRENLRVGAYSVLRKRRCVESRLERVLHVFPLLESRLEQQAGLLSGGERQMLALARAIMCNARLLLIDELSMGLSPVAIQNLFAILDDFSEAGVTMVFVEQSLNIARRLADFSYFLEKGEVRFSGSTADLIERGDIARAVFFGDRGA